MCSLSPQGLGNFFLSSLQPPYAFVNTFLSFTLSHDDTYSNVLKRGASYPPAFFISMETSLVYTLTTCPWGYCYRLSSVMDTVFYILKNNTGSPKSLGATCTRCTRSVSSHRFPLPWLLAKLHFSSEMMPALNPWTSHNSFLETSHPPCRRSALWAQPCTR